MELKKYKLGDIAEIYISSIDKKSKEGEQSVRLCNFVDIYHNWAITKDLVPNFMIASANDNNIKEIFVKKVMSHSPRIAKQEMISAYLHT